MRDYQSFLNKLLDLISTGDEESVSRVISVIRSGASHIQILDTIDQQSGTSSGSEGRNRVAEALAQSESQGESHTSCGEDARI